MNNHQNTQPESQFRYQQHEAQFRHLEGWLQRPAAAAMSFLMDYQDTVHIHGNIMEIGVYKGLSGSLLCLHAKEDDLSVFCDFRLPQDLTNLLESANAGKCLFLEKFSSQIRMNVDLPNMERTFRFIHIDGSHSGTDFMYDLRLAEALLSEDGIICVDDFFNPHYPQLTDATFHYIRQNPYTLSMFLCGAYKAFLGRPMTVHKYMTALDESFPEYLQSQGIKGQTLSKSTFPNEINCFGLIPSLDSTNEKRRGPDWMRDAFPY